MPLYSADRPEVHEIIGMMRQLLDQYDERMMVGEIYLPIERLMTYYGVAGSGTHLPFNFQLILLPWNARVIDTAIADYEAALPADGWPNWVLGNHDQHRIASRVGAAQARVAAMLLLTLRGTPTMYNGDELGMHDVEIPPELVQDPQELGVPGIGLGRDPERTPMQWDAGPNAGFTSGTPWLPLADDYERVNVAAERGDPRSMLTLYQRLIALRRATPALEIGSYARVPADGDLLAYIRAAGGRRFLIALNLGSQEQTLDLSMLRGRVVLSTHLDREGEPVAGTLALRADEGAIVELV
jgi:alpha-glucosidase